MNKQKSKNNEDLNKKIKLTRVGQAKNSGFTALQFEKFKNVSKGRMESIKKMYEKYGDNDMLSKNIIISFGIVAVALLIASAVIDFEHWQNTVRGISAGILFFTILSFVKKASHREGYLEGYIHGHEDGVEKSFGIDKDLSSTIADMAANADEFCE